MKALKNYLLPMVALATISACAKKADLPPPPKPEPVAKEQAKPAPTATPPSLTVAPKPAIVQGSLEDLIATAGGDRVFFAYDSADLDDAARGLLTKQAEWMKKNAAVRVTIEGHCDERGTREYNLALGDRRAEAVKSFLASLGVPAARVATVSYGKERPEVVGSDDVSYGKNRRGVTAIN